MRYDTVYLAYPFRFESIGCFMINWGNFIVLQNILEQMGIKLTITYTAIAPEHAKDAISLNPFSLRERQ